MKKIFILLTKYSDWISCLLYHIGGHGYTHVSLALEENENCFYSFNYRGFCVETIEKHRHRGVHKSLSYQLEIPEKNYMEIYNRIQRFEEEKSNFQYTRLGLLCAVLQIPFQWKYHYICSQFVAELLSDTGSIPLHKHPSLYLPNQLRPELEKFEGLLHTVIDPI